MHRAENMPKVTIVSAVWNLYKEERVEFFEQMMESVHNQTYRNIEHLIVNKKSTDGTDKLIEKYVEKGWARVVSESKQGVWHAMNKGIDEATGDFINFMNSDDFFSTEHAVELVMKEIIKTGAKWGYGATDLIDKNTQQVIGERDGNVAAILFSSGCPSHQAVFTSIDELRNRGGFDVSDPENPGVFSDNKIMIELILENKMPAISKQKIVKYRRGGISDKPENWPIDKRSYTKSIYRMLGQKWGLSLYEAEAMYLCDVHNYNGAFSRGKVFSEYLGNKIQLEISKKYYFDQLKKLESTKALTKLKYYFLGIPVLKYKQQQKDALIYKKILLFGFLPVWSKREWCDRPKSKISLLGIPILKFTANGDYSKRKWYLFCLIPVMKVTKKVYQ